MAGPKVADAQQTLFWRYLHPELYSTPTAGARPPALAFGDFFTAAREGRGVLRPMPTGQRYWPLEVNMQIANFFAGEFERRRHGDVARQAASGERLGRQARQARQRRTGEKAGSTARRGISKLFSPGGFQSNFSLTPLTLNTSFRILS